MTVSSPSTWKVNSCGESTFTVCSLYSFLTCMIGMSEDGLSNGFLHRNANNMHILQICESSEDDGKKLKRREKNRVAAQRSRKKQTHKVDELHEEFECLEQENSLLRKEVQTLREEQSHLIEALKAHEPLCPIIHCTVDLVCSPRSEVIVSCLPR